MTVKHDTYNEGHDRRKLRHSDVMMSVPAAPDGGWGWMVCIGAFTCMLLLDGMMFSFGVFFLELLDFFQEGKGKTALVGSVLMGMHLLLGPLVSIMVNMFGIRTVAMSGSIVACLAFSLSTLAPNLTILTITYGVFGGLGVSMVYIPSILAVGFYFDSKRALANGITQSGSGIGTFIYSPLCHFLQHEFGWKGALLILSGLVLNCTVCSALYRPLYKKTNKSHSTDQHSNSADQMEGALDKLLLNSPPDGKYFTHSLGDGAKALSTGNIKHCSTNSLRCKITPSHPSYLCQDLNNDQRRNTNSFEVDRVPNNGDAKGFSSCDLVHRSIANGGHRSVWLQRPLEKNNIFYSGSLRKLSMMANTENKINNTTSPSGNESSLPNNKKTWRKILDLQLLSNPVFLLCVASSVLWTTHSTILTILPDYSVNLGFSGHQSAMLLAIIGATNTVGRIIAGLIATLPCVDCVIVNAISLFVGSIMCVLMAFTHVYSLLAIEAAVFGLCMATWTSLRPIVLVELLGINNLTNAFGLLAMFQGLAFSVGPPVAGLFYDYMQTYRWPFILAACAFAASAAFCLPTRRLMKCYRKKGLKQDQLYGPTTVITSEQ